MDDKELIAIQDLEYEESLYQDKEKERIKQEKIKERKRIEDNINKKIENLSLSRGGDVITLRFRSKHGCFLRTFGSRDKLSDLYDYIYTLDIGEEFYITKSYPANIVKNDDNITLLESNIQNRMNLFIYY